MSKSDWVIGLNPPKRSAEEEEAAQSRLRARMDVLADVADQDTKIRLMGEAMNEYRTGGLDQKSAPVQAGTSSTDG